MDVVFNGREPCEVVEGTKNRYVTAVLAGGRQSASELACGGTDCTLFQQHDSTPGMQHRFHPVIPPVIEELQGLMQVVHGAVMVLLSHGSEPGH